jgi:hypothetical protein
MPVFILPRFAASNWGMKTEAEATNPELYNYFATFLALVYTFGAEGKWLAHGTVKGYLGALINMAKVKFCTTGTDATKLFFTALDKDSNTDSHEWYKKLKDRIWRITFQRAKEAGEKMDSSADPLYPEDFAKMVSGAANAQYKPNSAMLVHSCGKNRQTPPTQKYTSVHMVLTPHSNSTSQPLDSDFGVEWHSGVCEAGFFPPVPAAISWALCRACVHVDGLHVDGQPLPPSFR